MPKLIGRIDALGRPIVRVAVVGRDDDCLATVDTGFNGEIMMTLGDARTLGTRILDDNEEVQLGHGRSVGVRIGQMRLRWLGAERDVSVFISDQSVPTRSGPVLLIGTALLKPNLLLIDFALNTVEIETQD